MCNNICTSMSMGGYGMGNRLSLMENPRTGQQGSHSYWKNKAWFPYRRYHRSVRDGCTPQGYYKQLLHQVLGKRYLKKMKSMVNSRLQTRQWRAIQDAFHKITQRSARKVSTELCISRSTVYKVLQSKLHLYAVHIVMPALSEIIWPEIKYRLDVVNTINAGHVQVQ